MLGLRLWPPDLGQAGVDLRQREDALFHPSASPKAMTTSSVLSEHRRERDRENYEKRHLRGAAGISTERSLCAVLMKMLVV
jgi:hypothetical protein